MAAASTICRVSVPRFKWSQRLSPGILSAQTVFGPEARARKRSPLSMLKHFTSQRRHFAIFAQNRIGMPATRKYKFESSASCSL
ncbi:MAG: hypothetical protein DME33_07015 [Verrucomicrobia bacterium]|nr:MAG: hypothetical protein DME33_07015 [Verrucomicrobiota bacterium]